MRQRIMVGDKMEVNKISLQSHRSFSRGITACIGYFDGLHLGHQSLIKEVVSSAAKNHTIPALITFDPDPWVVLRGMHDPVHLTSMQDRVKIASQMGIEQFLILDFTKEMAALDIDAFHALLTRNGVKKLVCGHDFHYGQYGSGNAQTLLSQHEFEVAIIEPVTYDDVRISSTRIEQLIQDGDVATSAILLGRYYFLRGIVERGFRRGTTMHFPTANLLLKDHYLLPKKGVYAGIVSVHNQRYEAMINVGDNPTFANHKITIEANLFDFDEKIYDEPITFYFVKFIRDEKRFENREELIWQLKSDKEHIRQLFDEHPMWKEESLCV